jgi:hypothetical protein
MHTHTCELSCIHKAYRAHIVKYKFINIFFISTLKQEQKIWFEFLLLFVVQ